MIVEVFWLSAEIEKRLIKIRFLLKKQHTVIRPTVITAGPLPLLRRSPTATAPVPYRYCAGAALARPCAVIYGSASRHACQEPDRGGGGGYGWQREAGDKKECGN